MIGTLGTIATLTLVAYGIYCTLKMLGEGDK